MRGTMTMDLTGQADLTFTRDFAAPRALVWRALTEPALVLRWMAVPEVPLTTCEMDLRVGGALRWVWTRPGGSGMGVSGRYVEVAPPERLVHTELFDEDWTGGETQVTTLLTEGAPRLTRMVQVVRYSSAAARLRAMQSEMADGMQHCYDRLEAMLPELRAG